MSQVDLANLYAKVDVRKKKNMNNLTNQENVLPQLASPGFLRNSEHFSSGSAVLRRISPPTSVGSLLVGKSCPARRRLGEVSNSRYNRYRARHKPGSAARHVCGVARGGVRAVWSCARQQSVSGQSTVRWSHSQAVTEYPGTLIKARPATMRLPSIAVHSYQNSQPSQ